MKNVIYFVMALTIAINVSLTAHDPYYEAVSHRKPVLLNEYAVKIDNFKPKYHDALSKILKRYGEAEFVDATLTIELHGHIDIYSVIGAKMGTRARELCGCGYNEFIIVSYAGDKRPLSCLNDGLQISTGATLGRNTITVVECRQEPRVYFYNRHDSSSIYLVLRPEITSRVNHDLDSLIEKYGFDTDAFFENLEGLSFKYWYDLDRKNIFFEETQPVIDFMEGE